MKKILIGAYLAIALIISPFYWKWGEFSYMSYSYNLGAALMWPRSLFRSYPEIDGTTPFRFMNSFSKVERSGRPEGQVTFYESIGYQALYQFADATPTVTLPQVQQMLASRGSMNALFREMLQNPEIAAELRESLNGKTFGDIAGQRDHWEEALFELVEDRVPSASVPAPAPATASAPSPQLDWSLNRDALDALNPKATEIVVDGSSDDALLLSLRVMVGADSTGKVASSIFALTCLTSAQTEAATNGLNAFVADALDEGCEYGRDAIADQGANALFNDISKQDLVAFHDQLAGKSGAEVMAMEQSFNTQFQAILSKARQ